MAIARVVALPALIVPGHRIRQLFVLENLSRSTVIVETREEQREQQLALARADRLTAIQAAAMVQFFPAVSCVQRRGGLLLPQLPFPRVLLVGNVWVLVEALLRLAPQLVSLIWMELAVVLEMEAIAL